MRLLRHLPTEIRPRRIRTSAQYRSAIKQHRVTLVTPGRLVGNGERVNVRRRGRAGSSTHWRRSSLPLIKSLARRSRSYSYEKARQKIEVALFRR